MEQEIEYTVEQRTKIGMALYSDITDGRNNFAREVAAGQGDIELRMAIYWALNNEEKYADVKDPLQMGLLFEPGITLALDDIKRRAHTAVIGKLFETMSMADIAGMATAMAMVRQPGAPEELTYQRRERMQREAKQRAEATRSTFNAQHKPAPEGTVKELAALYGKSLSEIRRLKAAGELHTLSLSDNAE